MSWSDGDSQQDQWLKFDYEATKAKYFSKCEKHFKEKRNLTGPWTQSAKKAIIECIKYGTLISKLPSNLQNFLYKDVSHSCKVALEDGVDKLISKNGFKEFLSFEECFDIFVDSHYRVYHGNFDAMRAVLEKSFCIKDVCLTFFLLSCNICCKHASEVGSNKPNSSKFNDRVTIEILQAPVQDESCNFLLYYMDSATSFKILKPLISIEEYELSIELLKIFTDFGPPACIETMHIDLLTNVLSQLAQGGLTFIITLNHTLNVIGEEIINPHDPYCAYWSSTCCISQYKSNTKALKSINPHLRVFHNNTNEDSRMSHKESASSAPNNSGTDILGDTESASEVISNTDSLNQDQVATSIENDDVVFFNETKRDFIQEVPSVIDTADNPIIVHSDQLMAERDALNTSEPCTLKDIDNISLDMDIDIKEESDNEKEETFDGSLNTVTEHNDRTCTVCNEKMLTEFTCFRCKKYTHIFCLSLVIKRGKTLKDPIKGFTYCNSCLEF